jgi:hypothetical protein
MNTKIMALTIATTAFSFALHAQTKSTTSSPGDQSVTFGIRAGVNFTNINGKDYSDKKLDNTLKAGFNAGVNAEIPIAPDFYIQPGLLFTTKGAKIDNGSNDYKVNLSYLELPINFLYKPELGSGKLLLGVGPYVAYAVGGKVKGYNNKDMDIKFDKSITATEYLNVGAPYGIFKRFDAGGNLLVGYETSSKISIQLNAQLGMTKINPKIEGVTNDHTKWKNTGFGVSLGYRFM